MVKTQKLIKNQKLEKKVLVRKTSVRAFRAWTNGAVYGPGDSEYDKYAYEDFKKMGVRLAG